MKYKAIVPIEKPRSLAEIKKDLCREFQKPKYEFQCITEININKIKKERETILDYDQWFKILLAMMTFQI